MERYVERDWTRYRRVPDRPLEAMRAGFRRHAYRPHSHETYSFGVTETGAQAFRCRGAARTSAAGMVMAFNPDEPHDGHTATADGFVYRIVHIGPDLVADVLGDAAGGDAGLPLFAEPVVDDPRLAFALRRLNAALLGGADPLVRDERLTAAVLALVRRAGRRAPAVHSVDGASGARMIVARAQAALTDDLDGPGLAELAVAAGCSRYALYRAFQEVHGMPPSDYRRQLRLREARRLLSGGTAIADAAARTGFTDQAHLTRWFVRCYGVTPAAYARAA